MAGYGTSVEDRQKEEEKKKKLRRVYTTSLIEQLIKDRQLGYDIDYDPFYMRDMSLRAPGITFFLTPEEDEEYQKCYDDPIYYVKKYCKFMTDNGLATVDLRDFQKNVIRTVTEEVYIPENDDFGPKNRNVIWMAARQSGKCLIFNQLEEIKENLSSNQKYNVTFDDIYYKGTATKLTKIKKFLYKLYSKL